MFLLQPIRDRSDGRIEIWPATITNFNIPIIAKRIVNGIPNIIWEFEINAV